MLPTWCHPTWRKQYTQNSARRFPTNEEPEKEDTIDIINVVDRLETLINTSKVMPVNGSLLMDKKKIMELVDQLRLAIPQEMKLADEVLAQKDQIINNAMVEARRAKVKAEDEFKEKLSQNELRKRAEEILREAEHRANKIIEQAQAEAQAKRTEADAYALRSLRAFERELNTLNGSVRKGIDLLAGNALVSGGVGSGSPFGEND
jgi:vacuolar-type H+-ATPase subunit I/STV1